MSSRTEIDDLAQRCPIPFPRPGEGRGTGGAPSFDEQLGAWVLSAYDDVAEVLRDAQRFSSQHALGPERAKAFGRMAALIEEDPRASHAMTYFRKSGGHSDGAAHKRKRGYFGRAFTPARVAAYEAMIRSLCDDLTKAILGREEVEFVSQFAVPLTTQVIAQALGMPREDYLDIKRWSDGFEGLTTLNPTAEQVDAFLTTAAEFTGYMTPLIEERRHKPANDMISACASEDESGNRLDNEEALAVLAALMLAGNETTTGALAGTMMYLADDPDLQADVRADHSLIPALTEEGLRLVTPAQALFRTATSDVEINGARIAQGDHLYLRFAAANRDPAHYEEPMQAKLDRADKRHLTFGRGPHVCPGSPLARAELHIAFATLLDQTTSITISDRPDACGPSGSEMTTRVGTLYLDIRT